MHADLIIHNAKIYTVDPDLPWAEAAAMGNGHFGKLSAGRFDKLRVGVFSPVKL
jgi:predicted amidohydrolase YtcJ